MKQWAWVLLSLAALGAQAADRKEAARWRIHATHVQISRDNYGIAHIQGKSDADAVFGTIYAQAEDDFNRVERNYLVSLGWLAQSEGESAVMSDLRARLFVDSDELKRQYGVSPPWLKKLMEAWADGLNYYLSKHAVEPKVIRHFEPWMALSFTEGSIGGDIETVDLAKLEKFYGRNATTAQAPRMSEPLAAPAGEPGGSNGFAIAPQRSANGHALLWINPHTSFYFRSELQMRSEEGLNVYGAVTWGQFFVYQGFNSRNGWMHTSYGGDAIDEYAETVTRQTDGVYYRYGGENKRVSVSEIKIPYIADGATKTRSFTAYRTHHGPIVREEAGKWIAVKILSDPVHALMQSYLRTKTRDYDSFVKTQQLRTDTSNNTVYADADGTIAYFHGNFIPRRDARFDFSHPVDGSDPATEWLGAHELDELISLKNPKVGYLFNTNNWPFSAAGADSPKRENYPAYMWIRGENPRGVHAEEVLHDIKKVTLNTLIAAGYDPHLTAFDVLLPPLFKAFDALPQDAPARDRLKGPIEELRRWDRHSNKNSVATAVAIFWAQELAERNSALAKDAEEPVYDFLADKLSDAERIAGLSAAVSRLEGDFGTWQTAWGEINRYQRITDDIAQPFDDHEPSLPVGFAPAQWGALASFDSAKPRHTKKIFGSTGNSFICAVEFGPTVQAKALMSGGESGDPGSAHFSDQALMFTLGSFRDVYFYPKDIKAHAERVYHP
jgi:acyl-homoserine lactone acylase PvdQ